VLKGTALNGLSAESEEEMSTIACVGCGRMTNTAVSNHIYNKQGKADSCYAAFVNGEWVKGCGFNEASDFDKSFALKLIQNAIEPAPAPTSTSPSQPEP
jgi:hypothetical protein